VKRSVGDDLSVRLGKMNVKGLEKLSVRIFDEIVVHPRRGVVVMSIPRLNREGRRRRWVVLHCGNYKSKSLGM